MLKQLALLILLIPVHAASQALIEIKVVPKNTSIRYFKPFDKFGNFFIPSNLTPSENGEVHISVDINKPTFVNLIIGNDGLWLLVEPNDRIAIVKKPQKDERFNGLSITGNNSIGHTYYNTVFNYFPMDKALGIRAIFENKKVDTKIVFEKLSSEFKQQLRWVDSLRYLNQITKEYALYMKTEIEGTLAWEVGNLIDRHFPLPKYSQDLRVAKKGLFSMIDPTDEKLKSCGYGSGYYYTYYEFLYNQEKLPVDTSKVIIEELSFYALAPLELQRHLWGQDLFVYKRSAPAKYDYCKLFKKYKSIFKSGDYVEYFENTDICAEKIVESRINIIGAQNVDFFSFLSENFSGKRVFIDLWATWCSPCKKEFSNYDSSFYAFMKEQNIEIAYVSFDKMVDKDLWEKDVKAFQLQGTHAIADERLVSSIMEIFYPNEPLSVPRYILINENGSVISEDFKRPSNATFKETISELFNK
ncbi:MAG: thioredoxin-like domain-containing protein [Cyclobacteriaceae bacterium]|jgi:thiol-disulfide isomerase/thioredoxin|nr:thioredoxin-like domain-containing protein [Cyclobacteriaceae bacterium]